jgi:hypothetical protein
VLALPSVRVHDPECLGDRFRTIADHHVRCHAHVHVDEWPHSDQYFHVGCHPELDHDHQHVRAIGR